MTDEVKRKMEAYGITSVLATIVDGSINIVRMPDFPWICGDDPY
jgi:hypothetical protein